MASAHLLCEVPRSHTGYIRLNGEWGSSGGVEEDRGEMEKKKWVNPGVIFWVVIFTIVAIFLATRKPVKYNPDISVTFRAIEIDCMDYTLRKYVNPAEYKRCEKIVDLMRQEQKADHYSTTDYYKRLEDLGFLLPPLYWDELDEKQKIESFNNWKSYMEDWIRQCRVAHTNETEINNCVEYRRKEIQRVRQKLFNYSE